MSNKSHCCVYAGVKTVQIKEKYTLKCEVEYK
jgi:hypothetical protein